MDYDSPQLVPIWKHDSGFFIEIISTWQRKNNAGAFARTFPGTHAIPGSIRPSPTWWRRSALGLSLPDYVGKVLPLVRHSKGRTCVYANWGYEESKHSLALADWLLRSRQRTDEYMADLDKRVFSRQWNLPENSPLGMLAYAMVQEHATFVNYNNLRKCVQARGGDPALEAVLGFVTIDEAAHYGIFKQFFAPSWNRIANRP